MTENRRNEACDPSQAPISEFRRLAWPAICAELHRQAAKNGLFGQALTIQLSPRQSDTAEHSQ